MNIRERFEEIWPVPDGVYRHEFRGEYMPRDTDDDWDNYVEWTARLDTFTRCQESASAVRGIVDELIGELELIYEVSGELRIVGIATESIGRAKQKLEQIK